MRVGRKYRRPSNKKGNKVRRCRDLRRRYNISLREWNDLFKWQGGVCAACGSDDPGSSTGWVTDHDHETGKVRAILCSKCNLAIGQADHDPEKLELLAEYIKTYMRQFP